LVAILLVAAALRFVGLSWGLRHGAMEAERDFVHSVWEMVAARDLDQRFYEYPGLFFHLIYVPIALVQASGRPVADAYVAARAVVAAFGVLSVLTTFVLGRRLAGVRTGLLAALLLAVSPLEVETAHRVRTDVALETFCLLALLAFRRVGADWRGDLRAGLAIGLATALKPTGVLLVPSYFVSRWLAPGPRVRRVVLAGALAIFVVVSLTPYLLIAPRKFLGGAWTQTSYFFAHEKWQAKAPARPGAPDRPAGSGVVSRSALFLFYLKNVVALLGPVGAPMVLVGIAFTRREWREWAPILALPVTTLAVVSSAEIGHARLIVPAGGALALFAARGLEGLRGRWRPSGWAVGAIAVLIPLASSVAYVRGISRATPQDQVLDWIEANAPTGSRILSTAPKLGIDTTRYNFAWPGRRTVAQNRLVAREVDFVVAEPDDPIVEGLTEVLRAPGAVPQAGPTMGVFVAPPGLRPRYRPLPLAGVRLSVVDGVDVLPRLVDGDAATVWRMSEPRVEPWIQVELPAAARVGRVRLTLRRPLGSELLVRVTEDGRTWREQVSAGFQTTVGGTAELALLVEPEPIRGLRIEPTRKVPLQWVVAELALDEVEAATAPAAAR
jgi:4-amino-4-deoxy-L-arabinose transferase-like glycosyltransferase